MRIVIIIFLLMSAAVQAQVINGGFESNVRADQAPNPAWQFRGNLMPAGWHFNPQYGGIFEIVTDSHAGSYALALEQSKGTAHVFQSPLSVQQGDCLELSAWGRRGDFHLTISEYAGGTFLRTAPDTFPISSRDGWQQGGGYYYVTDPRVTEVRLGVSKESPGRVLVDDVSLRRIRRQSSGAAPVILENDCLRLILSPDGTCRSFYDKSRDEEVSAGAGMPFFAATKSNWVYPATCLVKVGNELHVTFGDRKARAVITCEVHPHWVTLRLKSWKPNALDYVTICDLLLTRLAITGGFIGNYDDRSARGIIALHYAGQTRILEMEKNIRFRCGFPALRGLEQAGCVLYTARRCHLEQTLREIELACHLPSPELDGAWGKQSPLMKRSYFFVTDLSESNVEEVIQWGRRGRFGYILILEDAWSHGGGTFAINEKNFPHGLDGLRSTIARLQAAGFKVGLHLLCAGMRGDDPMVSPVPDRSIFVDRRISLGADIDEKTTFIPTEAPPSGFPVDDGGYLGNGTTLRLNDEVITYRTVKLSPPYGFVDCSRGALRSTPAGHRKGADIAHLLRFFFLYLIDADSPLMERVSGNFARVWNYCNCDGIYLDGADRLQGDQSYYNGRVMMSYLDKLRTGDYICQSSGVSDYTWHAVSRMASADGFSDIKAYLDKRLPGFSWYEANLIPIDIGWYALNEGTRPDDIEYVCSKALGFNASVSIETGLESLNQVPQAAEMIDTLAQWESLRLSMPVTDEIKARLRQPGNEFHLVERGSEFLLVPVKYSPWAATPRLERKPEKLTLSREPSYPARLEIQIECGEALNPDPRCRDAKTISDMHELVNPRVQIGNRTVTLPVRMVAGDRLICRSSGECWLYRRGHVPEKVASIGALPPVAGEISIYVHRASHSLQFRAVMSWPELAIMVPGKSMDARK